VRALPLKPFHVDVLWASPDCREFSKLALPWFRNKIGLPAPSLELVKACRAVVDAFHPKFWIIENVMGSRKWLTPLLGPVRWHSTGHALFGNLPGLIPNVKSQKGSLGKVNGSGKWMGRRGHWASGSGGGKDGHRRNSATVAVIPYEIGEAICAAAERRAEEAA